ncbi:MAG: AAA domain-containing protein [Bacteroidota bacterium]
MDIKELGRLFYGEILKITKLAIPPSDRLARLYHLCDRLFYHFTKDENLQFNTSFARISFASHKYQINKHLLWRVYHFRKLAKKVLYDGKDLTDNEMAASVQVMSECVQVFHEVAIPEALINLFPTQSVFKMPEIEFVSRKSKARVVVFDHDEENNFLIGKDEDHPRPDNIRIKYNETGLNENFNTTIKQVSRFWDNKVILNLHDVRIDEKGIYFPRIIVIEPDYLVDVTGVADCFQSFGTEPMLYLLKKFLPFTNSVPLMLGHIANFFLDELIQNPEAKFEDLFPKVFRISPLAFSTFQDTEIKEIMRQANVHFRNLKYQVTTEFIEQKMDLAHCVTEPSFYSENYGLQGRLDVWYQNPESGDSAIVELKSGSPFGANRYGLSKNHYTQTLLYDLLIKSVYGRKMDPAKYILYSKLNDQNLKFAPSLSIKQIEALKVRNDILTIERLLSQLDEKDLAGPNILDRLSLKGLPHLSGFHKRDVLHFSEVLHKVPVHERKYFMAFVSFIAKEHRLAKTGEEGLESLNGMASLWRSHFGEKMENFEILSHLIIERNQTREEDPTIVFRRTPETSKLANFREGDIAILYPSASPEETVLNNQIFKCNIIRIDQQVVEVKLRSKQSNSNIFVQNKLWNLEHDLIDSNFTQLYRNLFAFLQFHPDKKALLLGKRQPEFSEKPEADLPLHLSPEQKELMLKALSAKDYFLLVGPPGTGKTKFMLREMVRHLLFNTKENLLLLAYTNRAVDEICEAIHDFASEHYIRVGSKFSTAEAYRSQLLTARIAEIAKRKELVRLIEEHRIFVGTVSSVAGKRELLELKKFNTAIIDEASQLLEPMLTGLLPRVNRFVLIGDHKQLPAVVMQNRIQTAIDDNDLKALGLINRRNSLFERLYRVCQKNEWEQAFGMLTRQGRMHQDISAFPSQFFYENKLGHLDEKCISAPWQHLDLGLHLPEDANDLEKILATQRIIYIPTPVDESMRSNKTNIAEANLAAELVTSFERIYTASGQTLAADDIGIITPYRAQIAGIRHCLEKQGKGFESISVDTVERYQGGARNIIIISLCLNAVRQLENLVSMTDDGKVDRKLNVALTRARQHLVILGNERVMTHNPIFENLVRFIAEKGGKFIG